MPEKNKQPDFTVTDRRKFTIEGEARTETEQAPEPRESAAPAPPQAPPEPAPQAPTASAPTTAEQKKQAEAFREATGRVDERLRNEIGGRRVQPPELDFQGLISSLYMTAAMQLGVAAPEGMPPQIDIIGARQTIDMLGVIADKTKGNLNDAEANLMQNCLYDLRMAYIEITNQLTKLPPGAAGGKVPGGKPPGVK